MSVYKCKMCGGTLEIQSGETVAVCEYCGTKQTVPKLDDERKANLYDRANHFRRNNEFDKAMGIYEQILNEDNTDADTYWSLVLCRYGIEYVEEPDTHKRIPTVNRAQFTSIFDDDNYKLALQYADTYQRAVYEEEAKAINEIQKGILAISQREEPFDVFICYKEKDGNGKRTTDSVLAQELYYELTEEGFKVFFARITLEEKLGSAYEPYIFAALNSAKVMVVLGTKPEFFNAVWVKNEWSRYLALIKGGAKKTLIPAYKDMDPYDLPEEFSHLQAQDVSKLGFMQDLIRGIKKIVQAEDEKKSGKETIADTREGHAAAAASTKSLLKRVFLFLEDGDWESADEYCERVLDIEPENALAYLGKLMAELKVCKQSELAECEEPFQDNKQYQKIMRFADKELAAELEGYISYIIERNENMRLEQAYTAAVQEMDSAKKQVDFEKAAKAFEEIGEYKDSLALVETCLEKAEECRKDAIYRSAKSRMNGAQYREALELLKNISGWKDADALIFICQHKAEELERTRLEEEHRAEIKRIKAKKRAKRLKTIGICVVSGLCAITIFFVVLFRVIIPNNKYNAAVDLMKAEKYEEAMTAFLALDGYRDSDQQIDNYYIKKYGEEAYDKVKDIQIGDIYTFGAYKQSGDNPDEQEEIRWIVLDKRGAGLLLISEYVIDSKQYNLSLEDVTWEDCSLREWLNETFINEAFSSEEQERIIPAKLNNESETGDSTTDKIFLLNRKEAEEYFEFDADRAGKVTDYVSSCAVLEMGHRWWLREPGFNNEYAVKVSVYGGINDYGGAVDSYGGVRPALWVFLTP